jgi:hypothetical protein
MWRIIAYFVLVSIVGIGGGIGVGFYFFPIAFPPPIANESLDPSELLAVIATGQFINANKLDPVHRGAGSVTVLQRTVFLGSDFEVGPGPKLHVYLVPKEMVRRASEVKGTDFIDLGPLRAFKGSQKYTVPATINIAEYKSVVIWNAVFGFLVSPADLKFL